LQNKSGGLRKEERAKKVLEKLEALNKKKGAREEKAQEDNRSFQEEN
jgi:hypothetical protein